MICYERAGDQVVVAAASFAVPAANEADKDKRKQRRRPNRRPKQNSVDGVVCQSDDPYRVPLATNGIRGPEKQNSVDGVACQSGHPNSVPLATNVIRGPEKAFALGFNSLPNMHISEARVEWVRDQGALLPLPPLVRSGKISNLCPLPGSLLEDRSMALAGYDGVERQKYFDPHWSEQAVNEAIEKGHAFRAVFRVNAYNRLEAYCTLDGVSIDILISGAAAQNRAIEGDVVAVMLDPVESWTWLKRSAGQNSNSVLADDSLKVMEVVSDVQKDTSDADFEPPICSNGLLPLDNGYFNCVKMAVGKTIQFDLGNEPRSAYNMPKGNHSIAPKTLNAGYVSEECESARALGRICTMIRSYPSKRPTGRVLAVIEPSRRRDAVVGFLSIEGLSSGQGFKRETGGQMFKKQQNCTSFLGTDYVQLIPTDLKFPEMVVPVISLPDYLKEKLNKDDITISMELIAGRIDDWSEESLLPKAHVIHVLGQGGEIEPQIAAIVFENAICNANFSPGSLSCLPDVPWEIPPKEFESRKDLRNLCIFTIDPSSAIDLDDALSIEKVSDDVYRVGVHIADVSYFVLPDTALDIEAQIRSTSVYILRHKLPMLPPLLSEELGSLIPSVDRLALSIVWDISLSGDIIDQWIGRSIIRSCCKLSYEHAQGIIDGTFGSDHVGGCGMAFPVLHGHFEWEDLTNSIRTLHEISIKLKENRFKNGALRLDNTKLNFVFDERGNPYDSILHEQKDSNSLVEEFMLLANKTVAEVISRTFPDSALLRRHPEPNVRKLNEFKSFCSKHGFELDASSSGKLHLSLLKIRERLKNDPVLFKILVSYASRPMQLATYFCTANLRDREDEWAHYALAVPFYTHFTSPLRRYPDILVHRTLLAVVEAEEMYLKQRCGLIRANKGVASKNEIVSTCFTGVVFNKDAVESIEGMEALSSAASKCKVPGAAELSEIVSYCNERKLASRRAEEAADKVYLWAMVRNRETIISEARVMGLGPRFMSVYIHKLAIERRIYYSEVEGLLVEWLENTSTLVLDLLRNTHFQRRVWPGKFVALEDVVLVMNPSEHVGFEEIDKLPQVGSHTATIQTEDITGKNAIDPAVLPLTLRLLSTIPVALHAVGGDDGPPNIGVRLYTTSYFGK